MDKELQLIQHLYDEVDPETDSLRELLGDPELAAQYRDLQQARFVMEHRPRARPRASLVNAVVRGAAPARAAGQRDRAPLRLMHLPKRRALAVLALAAALALTILVRPWSFLSGPEPGAVADNPFEIDGATESLIDNLPPAAVPAVSNGASTLPDWDSGDDLRTLSRRIESLKASGELAWDEPAVPLEMLPTGGSSGLTPAGSRR